VAAISNYQEALYDKRRRVDTLRQPSHAQRIEKLHSTLVDELKRQHPYELTRDDYNKLKELKEHSPYTAICLGTPSTPSSEYCYRITTWSKLVAETVFETRKFRLATSGSAEREIFDYFVSEHFRVNLQSFDDQRWLPLTHYFGGTYGGYREFTWWTPFPVSTTNPMCSAHHLGCLNISVGTLTIILRCPVSFLTEKQISHIPTAIDGYFFNIFRTTLEHRNPTCGRTISVEVPDRLTLGGEEFVVRPFDLDEAQIDLWPVYLDASSVHKIEFHEISDKLLSYYSTLGEIEHDE
jgi:hypothetical protein